MNGFETQVARAAGTALLKLGTRMVDAARREQLLLSVRSPTAVAAADRLRAELDPAESVNLARYVASPDFEQQAALLVLASRFDARSKDETRSAVREAIRHGLRHAGFRGERLLPCTDLVFDALDIACEHAMTRVGSSHLDPAVIGAAAHIAAMAARNGRLLSAVPTIAAFHELGERLRDQVRVMHDEFSTADGARMVPWNQLYVEPELMAMVETDPEPSIGALTAPGRRHVILGDPGAGKSTFVSRLAFDLASARSATVPFVLVLREFSEILKREKRRLLDHLVQAARAPYNVEFGPEAVEYLLSNGRAVVIIDGLDEITDMSLRHQVVALVEGFATMYPLVPVVITSRRVGYSHAPLRSSLFRTCQMVPFDDDRVEAYVAKSFVQDPSLAAAFLRDSQLVEDLRAVPLLLSLLCAMYTTDQYLPRNRAQVYERCAVTMYERWDDMRGVAVAKKFRGARHAVRELAWWLFQTDSAELPRRRVLASLTRHLGATPGDAQDLLDLLAGRVWVLVEVGATEVEPIYGFVHRTFMEYFAAEHLVENHRSPADLWAALEPHLDDDSWEVVAQLALQLVEIDEDGSGRALVSRAVDGAENPTRGLALTGFAARACGTITVDAALADRVVAAALASTLSVPMGDRVRFWRSDPVDSRIRAADAPLHALMYDSLEPNLRHIRASLRARLSVLAYERNDIALYLIRSAGRHYVTADERRVAVWTAFAEDLQTAHEAEMTAWRARHPWSAGGHQPVEDLVDSAGAAALYQSDFILTGSTLPHVLYTASDHGLPGPLGSTADNAHRLRDRLVREPTPWLPGAVWRDQQGSMDDVAWELWTLLESEWPRSGDDLATYLVLFLPYLESLADFPDVVRVTLPSDQCRRSRNSPPVAV
ncbi:NACHT domain-containing protein [Phytohabitans suffuscus]|uniref:NACHT domain-containing protein n=1 Tax=Phytohabitans suffuscus TaxID=624315 RepID=A0A6F8YCL7_9ACTN|nr:NACHT domain-containing protein [Phytohabitans suffuscus]BCB83701.1 hypothetical protein Psuf_010140 [Phytohabitans suffuscus]